MTVLVIRLIYFQGARCKHLGTMRPLSLKLWSLVTQLISVEKVLYLHSELMKTCGLRGNTSQTSKPKETPIGLSIYPTLTPKRWLQCSVLHLMLFILHARRKSIHACSLLTLLRLGVSRRTLTTFLPCHSLHNAVVIYTGHIAHSTSFSVVQEAQKGLEGLKGAWPRAASTGLLDAGCLASLGPGGATG